MTRSALRLLVQAEKSLQAQIVKAARLLGWLVYHTWRSTHSAPGFPDLVLVRPPRLVFIELKTDTGKVSPDQERWLEQLRQCPGAEVYLFRPGDWARIVEVLR